MTPVQDPKYRVLTNVIKSCKRKQEQIYNHAASIGYRPKYPLENAQGCLFIETEYLGISINVLPSVTNGSYSEFLIRGIVENKLHVVNEDFPHKFPYDDVMRFKTLEETCKEISRIVNVVKKSKHINETRDCIKDDPNMGGEKKKKKMSEKEEKRKKKRKRDEDDKDSFEPPTKKVKIITPEKFVDKFRTYKEIKEQKKYDKRVESEKKIQVIVDRVVENFNKQAEIAAQLLKKRIRICRLTKEEIDKDELWRLPGRIKKTLGNTYDIKLGTIEEMEGSSSWSDYIFVDNEKKNVVYVYALVDTMHWNNMKRDVEKQFDEKFKKKYE